MRRAALCMIALTLVLALRIAAAATDGPPLPTVPSPGGSPPGLAGHPADGPTLNADRATQAPLAPLSAPTSALAGPVRTLLDAAQAVVDGMMGYYHAAVTWLRAHGLLLA